jgi:hypothetical protein
MTGSTVAGRYLLTDMLGRGGFGTVYSGRDLREGGEVAVKVFSRREGFASRAAREARTASKLDHPNIQSVLGVERDDQHAYLISRLVAGSRFDRSDLSDEEAVRAVAAVCDALAHAHARGVIHRDVKPSNILVSDDGEVVLTDFGIARDRDAAEQTLDEKLLGTLSYMAPEQARGEQATEKTDVWAAALTLYEALCGHNPFRTKSLSDLLRRLASGAPSLAKQRPDLARPLVRTVHAALDPNPRRRPTALELRDRLIASLRLADEQLEAARPPREWSPQRFEALERVACGALAAGSCFWLLTAFPVYPPSWSLPLALAVGALAWRSAVAGSCLLALLAIPALWNQAEGSALLAGTAAGAWIWAGRHWGRRLLVPLAAVPLAAVGLGPAVVLVAATAAGARRRLAEGAAGGLLAIVAGHDVPSRATAPLAGTTNPLAPLAVLAGHPSALAVAAACAVFAPLYAATRRSEDGRAGQALALWVLGFGLVTVALPQAFASHSLALAPAAEAATVVAILAAAWALAAPRLSLGR